MRHRRSIRLRDYDYTQCGAYFVTICAHERHGIFGRVIDGEMICNEWGHIVHEEWNQTAILRPYVELDAFVVMPNHVHGIILIDGGYTVGAQYIGGQRIGAQYIGAQCIAPLHPKRGATPQNVAPTSLGAIVRGFKSAVTRRINRLPNAPEHPIWQRNYYEHIIRDEESLNRIRTYITNNPASWNDDRLYVHL